MIPVVSLSVLLLFEYPTVNGGENSLLSMTEELSRRGVEFQAAGPADGPLADRLRQQDIPILPLELFDSTGSRYELEECRRRIKTLLTNSLSSNSPVDVVHSNSLAMSRIVGPVVHQLGVPSIGHIRDIINISRRATMDIDLNRRVLAVSQATKEHHCLAGISRDKSFVLYNGIDLETFQPRPISYQLHRSLHIPDASPIVLSIGQIILRKGLDTLLSAAAPLALKNPNVHFVHVGARYSVKDEAIQHEAELKRLSNEGELAGRFHFAGTRDDVPQILNDATILVHTAKQEPLGRVLLEAAACGIPIVATSAGGTREILSAAECGTVVAIGDADELSREIEILLNDKERRLSIGSAARKAIEERFDVKLRATELLHHYESVANRCC
jgi:glycosyltransferase involved in cell wall biosynthesis